MIGSPLCAASVSSLVMWKTPVNTDNEGFQLVKSKSKGRAPVAEEDQIARLLCTSNGFEVQADHDTTTQEGEIRISNEILLGALPHPPT